MLTADPHTSPHHTNHQNIFVHPLLLTRPVVYLSSLPPPARVTTQMMLLLHHQFGKRCISGSPSSPPSSPATRKGINFVCVNHLLKIEVIRSNHHPFPSFNPSAQHRVLTKRWEQPGNYIHFMGKNARNSMEAERVELATAEAKMA